MNRSSIQIDKAKICSIPTRIESSNIILNKANSGGFLTASFSTTIVDILFDISNIDKGNNWDVLISIPPMIPDPLINLKALNTTSTGMLLGIIVATSGSIGTITTPLSPSPNPVEITTFPIHGEYIRLVCTSSTPVSKELRIFINNVT